MVIMTGDTHARFSRFTVGNFPLQKELTRDDRVIICGDFGGIWSGDKEQEYWLDWLAEKSFTINFIDGNHENYDLLYTYPVVDYFGGKAHKIRENVYHLMRGYVFDFEGKKYFTFGGARCHDIDGGVFEPDDNEGIMKAYYGYKPFRVNHVSWWKEEMPNDEEFKRGIESLKAVDYKVDYVVTHSLPTSILRCVYPHMVENDINELTSYFDELIINGLEFKRWYTGHYHMNKSFMNFQIIYEDMIEA